MYMPRYVPTPDAWPDHCGDAGACPGPGYRRNTSMKFLSCTKQKDGGSPKEERPPDLISAGCIGDLLITRGQASGPGGRGGRGMVLCERVPRDCQMLGVAGWLKSDIKFAEFCGQCGGSSY